MAAVPSPAREEQALAECAALAAVGPAKAILKGKLLEATHDDNPRVLAQLARVYDKLGLTAEATRVSRRVEELERGARRTSKPVTLPPPPVVPKLSGSLPPPPVPPPSFGRSPSAAPRTNGALGGRSTPPPPSVAPRSAPPAPVRATSSSTPPPPPIRTSSSAPPPAVSVGLPPLTAPRNEAVSIDAEDALIDDDALVEPTAEKRAPIGSKTTDAAAGERSSGVSPFARRAANLGVKRWHAIVAAVVALGVFCGYSAYTDHHLRGRLRIAEDRITPGTPDGLQAGSALLTGDYAMSWPVRFTADLLAGFPAERLPTGVKAAILRLWAATTLRLMGEDPKADLNALADAAERIETPPARVAFARVVYALDQGDVQKALSIVTTWEDKTTDDPLFQIVAGVAYARASNVRKALADYDAAHKLLPKSLTPLLLAADLAVSEDRASAADRLDALAKYDARVALLSARALRGLGWALSPVDDGPRLLPEDLRLSEEQRRELPKRWAEVPSIVRVKEAVIAKAPLDDCIGRAIAGADHATTVITLGRLALLGGNHDAALAALARLRKVAPAHPEGRRFALDVALSAGDLGDAPNIVAGDASAVAMVDAVIAYEKLDLETLESKASDLKGVARAEALAAAPEVQTGDKLLGSKEAERLQDAVWAPAVEIDSAFGLGELGRADQLLRDWNAPSSSAYLARSAELARYQGNAERALTLARRAAPEKNLRAFLEEVQALIALGRPVEALSLMKNSERSKVLGPVEKWTKTFVVGKARGGAAGRILIGQLPMPNPHAPIEVRLMAARAMVTVGDARHKSMLVLLEGAVPKHPMLELARQDK